MTSAYRGNGILCLEGAWSDDMRDRLTVRPLLEMLEGVGVAPFIHRDAVTTEELRYYLEEWQGRKYRTYLVLYLAMHGGAGTLHLGKDEISLRELARSLEGKCQGSVVYFGSCMTLDAPEDELKAFVKRTGARAVVGYAKEVDWVASAAFEVLLLEQLTTSTQSAAMSKRLAREHGEFARRLGLVVATSRWVERA